MGIRIGLEIGDVLAFFPFLVGAVLDFLKLNRNRIDPFTREVAGTGYRTECTAAVCNCAVPVRAVKSTFKCDLEDLLAEFLAKMVVPCMITFIV